MNNKFKVMAHLVAGFPTLEDSLTVAKALADGGASYLEVQFPFSDPSADGPAIQGACTEALLLGFKVDQGFEMVKTLRKLYPHLPVFIMSYASLVFSRGVKEFCRLAGEAGADGLIIPDLAPGSDEGLFTLGPAAGLKIVPVIVPSVTPQRLNDILALNPEYVYTAIRAGITGIHSDISQDLKDFLQNLTSRKVKVLAGFGIDSRSQVESLAPVCHCLVVGSAFVRIVHELKGKGEKVLYEGVKEKITKLV
ncbi:MAG: tryptophan synthase subunit alpha [Spirochaetes bacterium GWB1_48_6]|nr:MAG: tryptophan synthase subunit alpha [Spirochaetes bacterium GWB1_48_6]